MTERARVGLIGYGLAGSAFHAPLISTTHGLELAVIVNRDPAKAEQIRARYPGVQIVKTVEQLWPLGLDAAVVATPNLTHVPLATECIEHGIATVVDKPLALTSAAAADLIATADAAGVLLTTYQNRRWDGDYLTAKRLIESGSLGQVVLFESRFEKWRPTVSGAWKEQTTATDGGGLLFDLGSHLIDQALHLFGPAEQVYAEVDTVRPGAITDDNVFVALTHVNGTRSHLSMSAVAADLGPRLRVLGTAGAYVTHDLDVQEAALRAGEVPGPGWGVVPQSAWGVRSGSSTPEPQPTEPGDYPAFYRALADALVRRGPVPVDPRDALATLRVIEAARASSATRTVVTV